MRLPNTIATLDGRSFDYMAPEVHLTDVAVSLSRECRFGNFTQPFFSVAEHSVLVSHIVEAHSPGQALAALWHDAHEAYMRDLPTPLKALVGEPYLDVAASIDEAVCRLLGLTGSYPLRHPAIKIADELALAYEASVLKPGPGWEFTRRMPHHEAKAAGPILALPPDEACDLFLRTHDRLLKETA